MQRKKIKWTNTPEGYDDVQDAIDSLVASGHLEQKRDADGQPVFRPNSEGVLEPVWVATDKAFAEG